ncbi:hypothetical protein E0H75_42435 [Kribbella capetownensis]|uniref:Uncharacterized protein n=1 Tax=Kribbella capetownensis TaxID=1572659 RepID=A0A4R0IYJ5_9ACTN|nr:hypothetical protein [Kribbella capetownensis]TCC33915.1 hypothetical protein E0H75_42435 [Kribbella capetownensis]
MDFHHAEQLREWMDKDHRRFRKNLPRWHRVSVRDVTATEEFRKTPEYQEMRADTGHAFVWVYDDQKKCPKAVRKGTSSRACWSSRGVYLQVYIKERLRLPDAAGILRAENVDPETFLHWAKTESMWADPRTGRGVIVRPKVVAEVMKVATRTVQRCRATARLLGLYATVYTGRMLKVEEVWPRRDAGSAQRGEAAESAFVIPKLLRRLCTMSYLPRGAGQGQISTHSKPQLTLNPQGKKEQTSSALNVKTRRKAKAAYKLACQVLERLPWAREAPAKRLTGLLHRFATAAHPWTAEDIARHIDTTNSRRGWSAVHSPDDLRAPAYGLLSKYLRDTDPDNDHPRLDVFLGIGELTPREYAVRVAHQQVTDPRRLETLADHIEARVHHARGQRCDRPGCCA